MRLADDLSAVKFVRYSANFIPRDAPVVNVVDDVTRTSFSDSAGGFQDPGRLSPGFGSFSDQELEAAYRDQVETFVDYQTRVGLRAIEVNPAADLVAISSSSRTAPDISSP